MKAPVRSPALTLLEAVSASMPGDLEALRALADQYTEEGFYDEGLAVDLRLAHLLPEDPLVHYNLACSLAMAAEPEAAIVELRRAFERGYVDMEHLQIDPDLDNLRDLPAFQELLKEYGRHK